VLSGNSGLTEQVEQVTVSQSGPVAAEYHEFFLPPEARPVGLSLAEDGRLWFSFPGGIGAVAANGSKRLYYCDSGKKTSCPTPVGARVWFLDARRQVVSWISTSGAFSGHEISLGANSRASYLIHSSWGEVCAGGSDRTFAIADNGALRSMLGMANEGMIVGPSDAIWSVTGSHISAVDRTGQLIDRRFLNLERRLHSIILGPDGALWFIDRANKSVLRRSPTGKYQEFQIGPQNEPFALCADRGNGVWGTAFGGGSSIFHLTPEGILTWYEPPSDDPMLLQLAFGQDNMLWIIDHWIPRLIRMVA
jgi:streptogramin lyase